MKKSMLANIINIILILIFIVGIVCIFFIPSLYDLIITDDKLKFIEHNISYKITFYICYIISLSIIGILIKLFKSIYKDTPFKREIVTLLNIISIQFIILSIIIAIKCLFIPTIISICIALICFVVSLSFCLLKEIFKAAIIYKEEVDLTI